MTGKERKIIHEAQRDLLTGLYKQHDHAKADAAMYYIKSHGKNGTKLYDKAVDNR